MINWWGWRCAWPTADKLPLEPLSPGSGMKDIEPIMKIMVAIVSFKEKEGENQTQCQFRETDWFSGTFLSGSHRIKTEHNHSIIARRLYIFNMMWTPLTTMTLTMLKSISGFILRPRTKSNHTTSNFLLLSGIDNWNFVLDHRCQNSSTIF